MNPLIAVLVATSTAAVPPAASFPRGPATIECVVAAAQRHQVPANVLLAIASQEAGKNGQYVENKNGSQDIGHFQLNTIHWAEHGDLVGIEQEDAAWRGCFNAELAAWVLQQRLAEAGQDFWTRAANYHSRTPEFNARYRESLIRWSQRWGAWLRRSGRWSVKYQ